MNDTEKNKRLEKIELQLTPKQWAIRLADKMRQYPSEKDFLKAVWKSTLRQTPFARPFCALAEQAHERWPEQNAEHNHNETELNHKLLTEFQALRMLINNANEDIKVKAQTFKQKAAQQLIKLYALILQDALARTDVAETMPAIFGNPARVRHVSQLKDWADITAMLLMETVAYKSAVRTIQEKYFESHPILYIDIEASFEVTIQTVRDSIAAFNEYRRLSADLSNREINQGKQKAVKANATPFERESNLIFDIEAVEKHADMLVGPIVEKWTRNAKITANADILLASDKHGNLIWQYFQKELGLNSQ